MPDVEGDNVLVSAAVESNVFPALTADSDVDSPNIVFVEIIVLIAFFVDRLMLNGTGEDVPIWTAGNAEVLMSVGDDRDVGVEYVVKPECMMLMMFLFDVFVSDVTVDDVFRSAVIAGDLVWSSVMKCDI